MKILEDLEQWKAEYERGWLAHYQETGEFDWNCEWAKYEL